MTKLNLDFVLTIAITAFTRDSSTTRMQGKSQSLRPRPMSRNCNDKSMKMCKHIKQT